MHRHCIAMGRVAAIATALTLAVSASRRDPLTAAVVEIDARNGGTRPPRAVCRRATLGEICSGRAHVKAYVEFVHYVERLYDAAATSAHGHVAESSAAHKIEWGDTTSPAVDKKLRPSARIHSICPAPCCICARSIRVIASDASPVRVCSRSAATS